MTLCLHPEAAALWSLPWEYLHDGQDFLCLTGRLLLNRLPLGLDTLVGEKGAGLSRGEAQRVALGRVFLKNAPVLLLDEPTAGVDSGTERRVLDAIESFRAGRTVLTVTHRPADIRRADRMVVLEEGRIVAAGSLEELVVAGGPFQRRAGALQGGGNP